MTENIMEAVAKAQDKLILNGPSDNSGFDSEGNPEPYKVSDNPLEVDVASQATTSATTVKSVDEVLNAILGNMQDTISAKKYLSMLLYSVPDAGKTGFLGTVPNNFIIDSENGLVSHREMRKMGLLANNVKMLPYRSFDGFANIVDKFSEDPEELKIFETFSIDTVSTLHKRGLEEVTDRVWKQNPRANNRYVAETEHHTENNEHIRRIIDQVGQMPKNVIFTAHARTVEPKSGPTKTFPDFSEKLANTISGMVDVVGYLYIKEDEGVLKRILRLKSDGSISAKNRIGLPFEIEDPTWDKIYSVFLENGRTDN